MHNPLNLIKYQSLIANHQDNFKIIGLDFGKRKLGFAVVNWIIKAALPLKVISYQGDYVKIVKNFLIAEKAQALVVGDCGLGSNFKSVLRLQKDLEKDLAIPVFIISESLTTFEAQERLKDITLNYKKRNQLDDAIAAQIILEDFLQSCRFLYL